MHSSENDLLYKRWLPIATSQEMEPYLVFFRSQMNADFFLEKTESVYIAAGSEPSAIIQAGHEITPAEDPVAIAMTGGRSHARSVKMFFF
jgi:hypothetical protein